MMIKTVDLEPGMAVRFASGVTGTIVRVSPPNRRGRMYVRFTDGHSTFFPPSYTFELIEKGN